MAWSWFFGIKFCGINKKKWEVEECPNGNLCVGDCCVRRKFYTDEFIMNDLTNTYWKEQSTRGSSLAQALKSISLQQVFDRISKPVTEANL